MEGLNRSGSRRTRFIDDNQLENLADKNASSIFGRASTAPVFAVLHDAVPDLGNCYKESGVRITEPLATLANLTEEFNDLSRKMMLLKKTIKATRNVSTTEKSEPIRTNSLSHALQIGNLTDVESAKLVVRDCIAELTSVNHFLDGNEEIAAIYREKLRHAIADKRGNAETIIIQGVSLTSDTYSQISHEGKIMVDSGIGGSDDFLNRYKKEAEIQTETEQTEVREASTDKIVTKYLDANISSKLIDDASQQSKQVAQRKSKKR